MNTKFSKILKLMTVGMTLLLTTEYARCDDNEEKILCAGNDFSKKCGLYYNKGVLWTKGKDCSAIGGGRLASEDQQSHVSIFTSPECEYPGK